MNVSYLPILFFISVFSVAAFAEDADVAKIYSKYGIEGTLIIESLNAKTRYVHNKDRSEQRFLPASTFKIPNTLIVLHEGLIKSENQIIKWDGVDKGRPEWNKDHTIVTAFSSSCVWCYQKLAADIGNDKYLKHVKSMRYGNKKTGANVNTFWLNGELEISAREQVLFLRKLYLGKLPFKSYFMQWLKKIMLVEETPDYKIRAKTGWAKKKNGQQHGWYVGFVEANNQVWIFANNIKIDKPADAKLRDVLVRESLKAKGII